MFFRNLVLYRLPPDWSLPPALLEEVLAGHALRPCGGFDMQTRGWVTCGHEERFLYSQGTAHLLALGLEQKLLPAAVIRQHTDERAAELAQLQGYPVGRRQRRELKAQVTDELLARALTRRRQVHAWLNPDETLLAVDAASATRAELLVDCLRDSLGGLPVTPMAAARSPAERMAAWLLAGEAPGPFTLDEDLELQAADGGASIRYARYPLGGDEIRTQLREGLLPRRLGLVWRDRVAVVLNHDLRLSRLRFLHVQEAETHAESAAEQFDLDFALMTGELAALLADLLAALGGEARGETAAAPPARRAAG